MASISNEPGNIRMPDGFLFDTVTCSRWRRGDIVLRQRVAALPGDAVLYTSVITVGELAFGIGNAPQVYQARLRQRTQEMLTRFHSILNVTQPVAETSGIIVAQVPPGQHIGQNDYWIAAIAVTYALVLITNDPDFDRVPGLQKENWLA
jgi:predicted nucleic acid-binding protein